MADVANDARGGGGHLTTPPAAVGHVDAWLARADVVHRELLGVVLADGDLTAVVERLAVLLDAVTLCSTTDGRVLAVAGDPDRRAAVLASDCFDRTGRFVIEREPIGPRGPELDPGLRRRAVVRVTAAGADHARLALFTDDAVDAGEAALLERAAAVAAIAVAKQQAVATVEGRYRAEFLRDALAGRAGDDEAAAAHAESLGWTLDRPMVVVVAEMDIDPADAGLPREELRAVQDRFARAWTTVVRARDAGAPCVGFSREVVSLLGCRPNATVESVMASVGDVVREIRGDGGGGRRNFSTGVSRPVRGPGDLPGAYEEALKAVAVGRQIHGPGALTHYDGLGIYRLLALVPDTADLRRFVADALGDLATDTARENADLRRTLSVLLDTNLNVAETARTLHFHYNTLRYRITKLERMVGPFTTDPQLRLTLALALKILQMRGVPE